MSGSPGGSQAPIYDQPAEILKRLIQYNTTNPPGNEAGCVGFIKSLLDWAGIPNQIVASDSARPNLMARLQGMGRAEPLLLYGHVDVVTTENQQWTVNPFLGQEKDGYIWGRGALDMKGAIAMMLSALMKIKLEGPVPPGDVILAIVVDEEGASGPGAAFLVNNHPQLFHGVRYAIGEFGGYTSYIGGRPFYPIMVTEKQACLLQAYVRGAGGHAAWPARSGIMDRVARYLRSLERRLPTHIHPVVKEQVRMTAEGLPMPMKQMVMQLLVPSLTETVLDTLGPQVRLFDPILRNTAVIVGIHGGEGPNVVPSQVCITLDCRLLPEFTPDEMIQELKILAGKDVEYETMAYDPGPPHIDMGLYDTLAAILREADPHGKPTPMLLPATTDARLFARIGIQTYGFTPLKLPPDLPFEKLLHAADERVPTSALEFGAGCLHTLLHRFGE